jgi:acyl carrier protein
VKLSTRDEIVVTLRGALDRASNGRAKIDRLDDSDRIIEDIGLSSLDLLDLRCELEQLWQLKVADEDLAEMQTVGDIIHLIQARN